MPWKIISLVRARQQLIKAVLARRHSIQYLAGRLGISRKTAYKWFERFKRQGLSGLKDRSRRPRHSPDRLGGQWVQRILYWRRRRPYWGAKKIHWQLRQRFPHQPLPCVRSIHRCLQRHQRIRLRGQRAHRGPVLPAPGLTPARRANHVWTVDFKGGFRTADGQRQEPLTVRDLFSRYVLCAQRLPNEADGLVRRVFQGLFRRRGLPRIIRVDNGSPFAGRGALGLSRLSVWWLRLGIRVEFTRRARPGDNAAHEQFHGCYQREVADASGADRLAVQHRSNRWIQQYNTHRPHEALGQRPPASRYRPSRRRYPQTLPPLKYPRGWEPRRVRNRGFIQWRGRRRFVGRAFVGQRIGLKLTPKKYWRVYLGKQLIGHLHAEDIGGLRPAHWVRHHPLIV